VEAVRIRNGPLIFRCRVDDDRGFPVLEIPEWMFDASVCCGMELGNRIAVGCEALRELQALLAEAQQSSWVPGGTDAEAAETERGSAPSVPDAGAEPGTAERNKPKDRESAGTNVARTRREIPRCGQGGER
jgi:hypothetical protein